ncbi:MAG: hypothetical protein M1833_006460 [Piccolia ochrophora]|nr:MAG: hypothetical protein M1833_006460 [Piccolia ochrophora]
MSGPKYRMRNGEVYNDETIDLVWKMDVEYRFRCWLEVNGGKTRVSITSSDGVQTLWASELPSLKDGISITPKPSIQPHEGRGVHLNLKVLTKPEEDVQPTELRYQVVTRRAAGDPPEPVEEGPSSDAPWSSEVPTSVMWGPLETDDGIESSFLSSGIELNSAPHASPLEKPVAHSGSPPDSPSGSPPDSPFWSTISSSSSDSGSQAGTPGSSSGGPPKRPLLGPMASSFRIPGRSSSSPAGSSVSGGGGHQPITEEDLSARLVAHETLDDLEEDDLDGPPSFQ